MVICLPGNRRTAGAKLANGAIVGAVVAGIGGSEGVGSGGVVEKVWGTV